MSKPDPLRSPIIGTPFDGIGIPDGVKQAKELVEKLVNDK